MLTAPHAKTLAFHTYWRALVQELVIKLQQAEAGLASTQARRDELQQQLDQAVELYNVVQSE